MRATLSRRQGPRGIDEVPLFEDAFEDQGVVDRAIARGPQALQRGALLPETDGRLAETAIGNRPVAPLGIAEKDLRQIARVVLHEHRLARPSCPRAQDV